VFRKLQDDVKELMKQAQKIPALEESNKELNQKVEKLKNKIKNLKQIVQQFNKEATEVLTETPEKSKKRKRQ
jgi:predicted RNase H-like nuclease (RuvC/YqgF family)